MKLEIIKETKVGEIDWYILQVDGRHIKGSGDLRSLLEIYNQIKEQGERALETKKQILVSEEVNVSLHEINNKQL